MFMNTKLKKKMVSTFEGDHLLFHSLTLYDDAKIRTCVLNHDLDQFIDVACVYLRMLQGVYEFQ